jgi:hypothetical protein
MGWLVYSGPSNKWNSFLKGQFPPYGPLQNYQWDFLCQCLKWAQPTQFQTLQSEANPRLSPQVTSTQIKGRTTSVYGI